MQSIRPAPAGSFLHEESYKVQPALVQEIDIAIGPRAVDERGSCVDSETKLILGAFQILDIVTRSKPSDDLICFVENRPDPNQKAAQPAVEATHARFLFEGFAVCASRVPFHDEFRKVFGT